MVEKLAILRHFIVARWGRRFSSRRQLLAWQEKQVAAFLRGVVRDCPFYAGQRAELENLPVISRETFLARFADFNAYGITLQQAEEVALAAEQSRDFSASLPSGISVGLSSGTSGRRGVFLVSGEDRARWAGIVLARTLSPASLRQILFPWRPPLKIAFFLRADSNLYRTLASRRIAFRFYDLLEPLAALATRLRSDPPDILVAPATVLAELATMPEMHLRPRQVLSVAEVLDTVDAVRIADAFGTPPVNVYQATEGFLASTCREGRLHLNEEHVHIGTDWIDAEKSRFHPVVTDFSRRTQYMVRYRLDDILQRDDRPCPCGRAARVIRGIEGRNDEVLQFGSPVFPDAVRQALYSLPVALDLYRIEQHGSGLRIMLRNAGPEIREQASRALGDLFIRLSLPVPAITFLPWTPQPAGEKQRRIRCITPLSSLP